MALSSLTTLVRGKMIGCRRDIGNFTSEDISHVSTGLSGDMGYVNLCRSPDIGRFTVTYRTNTPDRKSVTHSVDMRILFRPLHSAKTDAW